MGLQDPEWALSHRPGGSRGCEGPGPGTLGAADAQHLFLMEAKASLLSPFSKNP